MIITSFCFFGTYDAITQMREEPDRKFGIAMDGSPLMQKEIGQLTRFIETDLADYRVLENKGYANFLNDGFVKSEIFQCGIAKVLFDRYQGELKEELKERLVRFQKFKPYEHPQKVTGVEMTWKRFMPAFFEDYQTFKGVGVEPTAEAFAALSALYMDQSRFPPALMRQMLRYQQQQYGAAVQLDPYVHSGDLTLFHAASLSDWFGPKFVELTAQFIHNAAIFAKNQGYVVTEAEAKASLLQSSMQNMQQLSPNEVISGGEFEKIYQRQLKILGLTEREAVAIWQKVLLMRRMLDDVGFGLFVDSLVYDQFHDYVSRGARVEVYQLPKALRLKNAEDVIKLDLYLDAVTNQGGRLDLSGDYRSVEEVMAIAPELVEKRFKVSVARVRKEDLERDIALRDTWEWEVEDQNWALLKERFKEISGSVEKNRQERFAFLETLDVELRDQIDGFAREKIVSENLGMIRERLSSETSTPKVVRIALKGVGQPLVGINDRVKLLELLEKSAIRGEGKTGELDSFEKLSCYTEDGKVFYRIHLLDRSKNYEIMTFEDAMSSHALDLMLDTRLQSEYVKRGYKESFEEVREQIAKSLFAKVVSNVIREEREYEPSLSEGQDPWEVAKDRRLGLYMRRMKELAALGDESVLDNLFSLDALKSGGEGLDEKRPIQEQWRLVRSEKTLDRKSSDPLFSEDLFTIPEGGWSDVIFGLDSGPVFYQILERSLDVNPIKDGMREARGLLGGEARSHLIETLVDEIKDKGAIAFSKGALIDDVDENRLSFGS